MEKSALSANTSTSIGTISINPKADKALFEAAKEDDMIKLNVAIQAGANVDYQSFDKDDFGLIMVVDIHRCISHVCKAVYR